MHITSILLYFLLPFHCVSELKRPCATEHTTERTEASVTAAAGLRSAAAFTTFLSRPAPGGQFDIYHYLTVSLTRTFLLPNIYSMAAMLLDCFIHLLVYFYFYSFSSFHLVRWSETFGKVKEETIVFQ